MCVGRWEGRKGGGEEVLVGRRTAIFKQES